MSVLEWAWAAFLWVGAVLVYLCPFAALILFFLPSIACKKIIQNDIRNLEVYLEMMDHVILMCEDQISASPQLEEGYSVMLYDMKDRLRKSHAMLPIAKKYAAKKWITRNAWTSYMRAMTKIEKTG